MIIRYVYTPGFDFNHFYYISGCSCISCKSSQYTTQALLIAVMFPKLCARQMHIPMVKAVVNLGLPTYAYATYMYPRILQQEKLLRVLLILCCTHHVPPNPTAAWPTVQEVLFVSVTFQGSKAFLPEAALSWSKGHVPHTQSNASCCLKTSHPEEWVLGIVFCLSLILTKTTMVEIRGFKSWMMGFGLCILDCDWNLESEFWQMAVPL